MAENYWKWLDKACDSQNAMKWLEIAQKWLDMGLNDWICLDN